MNNAHPDVDLQLIERIVREVVLRLRNEHAHTVKIGKNLAKPAIQAGSLSLDEKVISVETLRGKLENVSQLSLQPNAVLTPAARDELRDNGVEIVFEHAVSTFAGQPELILATTDKTNDQQFLARLTQIGIKAQLRHDPSVRRLVANLTGRFSTTTRGIVLTDQPYQATCVANRNPGVRAAIVRDEIELKIAKQELHPNVIVIPIDRSSILDAVAKELVC